MTTTTTELSAQAKKTCKGMQIKDKITAGLSTYS